MRVVFRFFCFFFSFILELLFLRFLINSIVSVVGINLTFILFFYEFRSRILVSQGIDLYPERKEEGREVKKYRKRELCMILNGGQALKIRKNYLIFWQKRNEAKLTTKGGKREKGYGWKEITLSHPPFRAVRDPLIWIKKNVENNHQRIQLSNCRIMNSFMESWVVHFTWLDCDLLVLFLCFFSF